MEPALETTAVVALGIVAALAVIRIVSSFVSRTYQRCAACASADRVCDLAVVAMSAGMAAMIVAHEKFPPTIGVLAFGVCAGWFAYRVVRTGIGAAARSGPGSVGGFALHHLVSCVAMVVMSLTMTSGWHHVASSPGAHHAPIAPAALIWGLGTYFVVAAASAGFVLTSPAGGPATSDLWRERDVSTSDVTSHTLQKMQRATTVSAAAPAAVRAVTSRASVAGSEVVMSAAMALMLFQAL